MQGITYQSLCDSGGPSGHLGASTYAAGCIAVTGTGSPPSPANLANTVSSVTRGATSFVVYSEFDCAPVGNQQAQATAERALSVAEPWQVENAFWTGQAGGQQVVFPHLAANAVVRDSDGVLLQPSAVNVTGVSGDLLNAATALGLIESAMGDCYGGVGVIHVPDILLPTLDAWDLIKRTGNSPTLYTANGNKVAVGIGFQGTGPDGSNRSGNACWMYGTGNVFGYRSQVRVRAPQGAQAMDRAVNTMRMIAERTYVLGWDCCLFAAQVSLGVPKGT
jgi:hypothetical protein